MPRTFERVHRKVGTGNLERNLCEIAKESSKYQLYTETYLEIS